MKAMGFDTDSIRQRIIALTRDLVLIPSIPSRPDDRRRCYEFVRNHLEAEDEVEITEYEDGGIPSLMAAARGCREPDLLICAHLDVITHPDVRFYRSEIRDGRIIGPGAGDMKGTLAIVMELFRTVHRNFPGASLGLAVTSDEEMGGESGVGFLFQQCGLRCANALIPDGGSLDEITVDEKGIIHLKVKAHGHPAHAARPWLGDNPIERLISGLDRVRGLFKAWQVSEDHWHPTCAITVIATENSTVNRIPSDAHALLDLRFPSTHTVEEVLAKVCACLREGLTAEVLVSAEATHLSPDPLYREITEKVTGRPASHVRESGGSDARFICGCGIPVQMSRPLVGNLHAADEWIDIDSMVTFYRIYDAYIRAKLDLG